MADRETQAVYAARAADYVKMVETETPDAHLAAFIAALPKRARALDLGCGPARATATMRAAGIDCDALDASPEFAALARDRFGINVRVADFADLDPETEYDGIYANFSLLHAPKAHMPDHLARIARALKPGGLLHLGLKTGEGEHRDSLGRFYAYYTEPELDGLLAAAGLTPVMRWHGEEAGLAGTVDPWIILHARKTDA